MFGKIRIVEVVVFEGDERRKQDVVVVIGGGNRRLVDGVVAEIERRGVGEGGRGNGSANGCADVKQVELRHIAAEFVLVVMEVGVVVSLGQ